ncbi:DUF1064 domain-containing protein [Sphingobium yanoikuyae]|uniref:DUF1064 domain-containing protein n=1 Tax=Sphingobium yanoikuyae TaxID=13690 RepID=UPI0035C6D3B8
MKRPHKYGAKKTTCQNGHKHDSGREAKRCNELHLLQRGNKIAQLEVQQAFHFVVDGRQLKHPNGRRAGMTVDFYYVDLEARQQVAEDAKGFVVRDYPLRAALFRHCFPMIDLREV